MNSEDKTNYETISDDPVAGEIFKAMHDSAKKSFEENGEYQPMFHFASKDGKHYIFCTPFPGPREKALFLQVIAPMFCAAHDIHAYSFANEAWSVKLKGKETMEEWQKTRPASLEDDPNRIEILASACITRQAQQSKNYEIVRDSEGKATLEEDGELNDGTITGMFTEVLKIADEMVEKIGLEKVQAQGKKIFEQGD